MRLVAISDIHLDRVTAGVRRREELASVLDAATEYAVRWKADLFLFLGDLGDPDGGSGVLRLVWEAIGAARFLHKEGIPSVWMNGNHDVVEDGEGGSTLLPLVGAPGVTVSARPTLHTFKGAALITLPFPSRASDYDGAEELRRLASEVPEGTPLIVASHLSIPGMHPGSETTEMARGRDVGLPVAALKALRERYQLLVLQGHYHRGGMHVVDGLEVHIVGAPARLPRDEADDREPGFLTVEV